MKRKVYLSGIAVITILIAGGLLLTGCPDPEIPNIDTEFTVSVDLDNPDGFIEVQPSKAKAARQTHEYYFFE